MLDEGITCAPLRRIKAQLPYLPRALGLVWTAARRWTAVWVVLLIVQGLLPTAMVLLVRAVVDALLLENLGRFVESGSDAELLELGGRYARSWHEQVQAGESCLLR